MQVSYNTISPKYNNYNPQNSQNKQQPSFGARTPRSFGTEKIIPKIFDNKIVDKATTKLQNTDNLFKHFLAVGSAITSGMYMYKTLTNEKLEQDRKNTLAVNQFLTFALSTAGAYALDGYLTDWWQKQTVKYAAHSLEDKTLLTDFVDQFEKVKAENKEIKKFNKTAAAIDKKDLKVLKAESFIKEHLDKYLVDKTEKTTFMNRVKGMGFLKSMLVFALVYRYIVPVAVTKPANLLCEKYLAHKKAKESENAKN